MGTTIAPSLKELQPFVLSNHSLPANRIKKGTLWRSLSVACLLLILFVAFPRLALVLLFFFSNYLQRAYHGVLLPLLGFLFLPLTTLIYAWMVNSGIPTTGLNLLILIIAVVIDLGSAGGSAYHRRVR
jgi:hypothetical protein